MRKSSIKNWDACFVPLNKMLGVVIILSQIDFSGLPDGIYNLRFVSSKNVQTGRVIKN